MIQRLVWSASVIAALVASPAWAATAYLQNDTFTGGSGVNTAANFEAYNGAAVWLGPDDAGAYPITLVGIAVLYVPASGAGSSEAYQLEVYSGVDAGYPGGTTPGDIYSDYANGTTLGLDTSTTSFNVFNFPTGPVTINRPVFVRLTQNYSCSNDGVCYSGTIAVDESAPAEGVNFFWRNFAGQYLDLSYGDAGYPVGNWVIRGVISVPDVDAGSTTTTTTTTTSSSSSSSSSTSGSGSSGSSTASSSSSSSGAASSSSSAGSTSSSSTSGTTTSSSTTSSGTTTGSTTTTGTTTSGTTGTTGTLSLTSVSPTSAHTLDDVSVTLIGANFAFGIQAVIGSTTLTNPDLKSPALLTATLPHGTAPGTYDVTVVNPDGHQATLPQAFTIVAGGGSNGSGSSGGTTSGNGGAKSGGCGCNSGADAAMFGLPALLLALSARRRRAAR